MSSERGRSTATTSADVSLLATIVAAGSLAAAGHRLDLSPASVSGRLSDLERRLGVAVLRRTRRGVRLTIEGDAFLSATRPILGMLEAAEDAARAASHATKGASGLVRLTAPVDLGRQYLIGAVDRFMAEHGQVRVELILSDEVIDLASEELDLAVRYGDMPDTSGLVASFLARNRRIVCGAPAYLDRVGRPERPGELAGHNCLCLRTSRSRIDRWPVGPTEVAVNGDRTSNDGVVLREWAVRGHGLVLKSWWDVREDVAAGRLKPLFGGLPAVAHPLRLVRPAGGAVPARVQLLSGMLKAVFSQQDGP